MKSFFRPLPSFFVTAFFVTTLVLPLLCLPPEAMAARKKPGAHAATSSRKTKAEQAPSGPECKSLYLMEPLSGSVIQEQNPDEPLYPASMTKLMTSYVVMKRMKEGSLKPADMITVSAHASKIGGSQVYLKENEQFTVKELLDAVLIQSANDAAMAIAEHVGGTAEGFVALMNQEAKSLGMSSSTFASPHGLPPSAGEQADRVTARDMGTLARALLKEFPQVLDVTKQVEADFRGGAFHMQNHNHLLRSFPGCDGLKTGFYNEAGFNITATAVRNGVRMIAVAMDCNSRKGRDNEVAKILSVGLSQYRPLTIATKGQAIDQKILISGGEKESVPALPDQDLLAIVRAGDESKVVKKMQLCTGLEAPVQANTPCGFMAAYLGEKELGRVGIVVGEGVQQLGRLGKIRSSLGF